MNKETQSTISESDLSSIIFLYLADILAKPIMPIGPANFDSLFTDGETEEEARTKLAEGSLALSFSLAKKFRSLAESIGIPFSDIVQEANLALTIASHWYNPELGFRFSTYATVCITGHLNRCIRSETKRYFPCSDYYDETTNSDGFEDPLEIAIDHERANAVAECLAEMPYNIKKIMELKFGFNGKPDMNQSQIARKIGYTRSNVSFLVKKGLNNMRNNTELRSSL